MASVSELEEGSQTLKSYNLERINSLYEKLSFEIANQESSFIKEGDHFRLLSERKGLSRCHLATWCLPKVAEDFIPLK